VDVGPAHTLLEAQLPPDWTAQQVYDNHEVLMLHGQRVCFFRGPACRQCVVLDLCPFGQARIGLAEPASVQDIGAEQPAPGAPAEPAEP